MNVGFYDRLVLLLVLWLTSNQVCEAGGHHVYKTGFAADTCTPDQFHSTHWTDPGQRVFSKGSSLVGTAFAQRTIWEHQFPHDCKAVNYILWEPTWHGIGSNYHLMGGALAYALALKRVLLLMNDRDHPYYDASYCGENEPSYHNCYFEPISNCTLEDAMSVQVVESAHFEQLRSVASLEDDLANEKVVKIVRIPQPPHTYPPQFKAFLETSSVDPKKFYYWWRAQSVAFLLRPNSRTLIELNERSEMAYPQKIEEGTISCHIRHGDKHLEYPLLDEAAYVKALEEVILLDNGKNELKRQVFLLTDDPKAVHRLHMLKSWNVTSANVPRSDKHKIPAERARHFGKANELLFSLVDLDLALQCDAWVGTMTSNWSRLIDELRSTVRCKAHRLYWDAAQSNPPSELEWR